MYKNRPTLKIRNCHPGSFFCPFNILKDFIMGYIFKYQVLCFLLTPFSSKLSLFSTQRALCHLYWWNCQGSWNWSFVKEYCSKHKVKHLPKRSCSYTCNYVMLHNLKIERGFETTTLLYLSVKFAPNLKETSTVFMSFLIFDVKQRGGWKTRGRQKRVTALGRTKWRTM